MNTLHQNVKEIILKNAKLLRMGYKNRYNKKISLKQAEMILRDMSSIAGLNLMKSLIERGKTDQVPYMIDEETGYHYVHKDFAIQYQGYFQEQLNTYYPIHR